MVVIAPAVLRAGHLWIERFLIFSKNGTAHFFLSHFFLKMQKQALHGYISMKCKMSRPTILALIAGGLLIGGAMWSNIFSNTLMLVMGRVNFIPSESSIFSFEPYEINQGSSSYWIYGQDRENYYYFSYQSAAPYIFISKANDCQGFDRLNFKTWCGAKPGGKK